VNKEVIKETSVLVLLWPYTIWTGMEVNPDLDSDSLALTCVTYGTGFARLQY
jgi:hypothetical protein